MTKVSSNSDLGAAGSLKPDDSGGVVVSDKYTLLVVIDEAIEETEGTMAAEAVGWMVTYSVAVIMARSWLDMLLGVLQDQCGFFSTSMNDVKCAVCRCPSFSFGK